MKRLLVGVALGALFAAAPAMAASEYPKEKYDATYTMSGPAGASEMRMASDGAGRVMTETKTAAGKFVSIADYKNMTSTSIIEQSKMAMQSKLPATSAYVSTDTMAKKPTTKPLGNKVIGGHPCKGYAYSDKAGSTEVWVGDDVKIMVQSTTSTPQGKTVMTLKSFKSAPPATAFNVPPGYKMMVQ